MPAALFGGKWRGRKGRTVKIWTAKANDCDSLLKYDKHITNDELYALIQRYRVMVAEKGGIRIGWLKWNLFWDNIFF
jgi:hypothetical protein